MDDRRREHRADADARDHGGGLSHHAHDCTHQRPISGGSQPPESEGQHTRQQEGYTAQHEQYHAGGGIGQRADFTAIGAHISALGRADDFNIVGGDRQLISVLAVDRSCGVN